MEEKSNHRSILLLLLAAAALSVTFCLFSTYSAIHCSALCISNFSSKGNYAIAATISYSGHKLSAVKVLVLINSKYKSSMVTSSGSNLRFQAPLKIGMNTVKVEYGNSGASVKFFYMGGLLYTLLVPLGAIFFMLIKLLAYESLGKNKVAFHFNDGIMPNNEAAILRYALDSVVQKGKRAVAGLPELISDVSSSLSLLYRMEGVQKIQKDGEYLLKKIEALGVAHVLSGCVGYSPATKSAAGARIFYENAVLSGSPVALSPRVAKTFIDANNIVFQTDLSIPRLLDSVSRQGKINLILFGGAEKHALSRAFRTYSKLGAALLMMRLNGTLHVLTQW
jgi:hypothetical protein